MSYAYQNFVTTNITSATGTKEPYMILLKSVLKDAW